MNAHLSEILTRRSMAAPNAAQQAATGASRGAEPPFPVETPAVAAPLARATDPLTSHDAAARAAHSVAKHEAWIFDAIYQAGERGATAKEIAAATKLTDVQVSRRLSGMGERGLIKRNGAKRNGCCVWCIAWRHIPRNQAGLL